MTSKKYLTTHRGELTNRPDMDNLDAGTPLGFRRKTPRLAGNIRRTSLSRTQHSILYGGRSYRHILQVQYIIGVEQ